MNQQLLFLMLGYPGSGKSTFAKLLAEMWPAVRLNSDELRVDMFAHFGRAKDRFNFRFNPLVFGALDYSLREILRTGYSVIYDANNNHVHERDKTAAIAANCEVPTVVIWINTPVAVARERERARGTNIPDDAYQGLAAALEQPLARERTIAIDGLLEPSEQLAAFRRQFKQALKG